MKTAFFSLAMMLPLFFFFGGGDIPWEPRAGGKRCRVFWRRGEWKDL